MARFSGNVGYVENVKTGPGKWVPKTTVRHYFGDVTRAVRRLENGQDINDNVVVNNEISVIADPYARAHFFAIRYVEWQGVKWKVSNVELVPGNPRMNLTLGGIYNENS